MKMTINSRKLGPVEFSRPGMTYIYVTMIGHRPDPLGQQICDGGGFTGSTITYRGDNQASFEAICRRWYRAYMRNLAYEESGCLR